MVSFVIFAGYDICFVNLKKTHPISIAMTGLFMTRPVALRNEPMSRGCRRKSRGSKARWRHAPWQLREKKQTGKNFVNLNMLKKLSFLNNTISSVLS